jgi:hypothetical protein
MARIGAVLTFTLTALLPELGKMGPQADRHEKRSIPTIVGAPLPDSHTQQI